MPNWPNWRELKKTIDDPERREELRANLQRGAERGRDSATKRLAGPAAHLRNVGEQFKAALNDDDAPPAPPSTGSAADQPPPSVPPAQP